MINKTTKVLVGLFVAAGTTIAIIAVIWLGMSDFLNKGQLFALYFDESVQGLNVDAPVKYRGVSIGAVDRINVAADSHLIEVVLKLDTDFAFQDKVSAKLKVVGITGKMFIELDRMKPTDIATTPHLSFPTEYPVIATRPSDIKALFQTIDEIVQKLNAIDISGVISRLEKTLDHLDQAVQGADTAGLSAHIKSSLDIIDQTVVDAKLPKMIAKLETILVKFEKTMQQIDLAGLSQEAKTTFITLRNESKTLIKTAKPLIESATSTLNSTDEGINNLNNQLFVIGQNMEQATNKLNVLLDRINDQPSQLLFGEPPPRRIE